MTIQNPLIASLAVAVTLLGGAAQAALTTYTSEAAFTSGVVNLQLEGFEAVAAATRSGGSVNTSAFKVTPVGSALLGVQDGPTSPENGNGASAVDGTHYLYSYLEQQPTGTLRFDLSSASRAFGLYITDAGEASGQIIFQTDGGQTLTPLVAYNFPNNGLGNQVLFFGFAQDIEFKSVFLTITGFDEAYGVDKVYSQSALTVPEPGTGVLLLGALTAGWAASRRRKLSQD
jgi:hypothetical protein